MPTLLNRHTLIKRTYPYITCNLNGFLDKIWTFGIVCKRGRPEQVLKARLEIKLTSKEAESSALTPARG